MQALPRGLACVDAVQAVGKVAFAFDWSGARAAMLSAHKLGGPKGVGALLLAQGAEAAPVLRGGGQELGRRAGTENVVGIAGFGAAVEAAAAEAGGGRLGGGRRGAEYSGGGGGIGGAGAYLCRERRRPRLPDTSAFAVPGWKGETQVMQMDLAGYAVSAGSACSSGKVRASRVLGAMGLGPEVAGCADPGVDRARRRRATRCWASRWPGSGSIAGSGPGRPEREREEVRDGRI